jgi:serine/threonine-protein kinase HipA
MKELKVHYRGFGANIEVGTLADDGTDVLFQYSAQAIAEGLDLSPIRLPLRTVAYPDQQEQYVRLQRVPGLLADSLPDSWGYLLMDRRMRAWGLDPSKVTTLDRLAYLGDNTMGALTYSPGTDAVKDSQDFTLLELANEIQALLVNDSHAVLAAMARAGGSPGGARPKALVYFNPTTGKMSTRSEQVLESEPWLVKFPATGDSPDSCALEELYAQIAQKCDMGMYTTKYFELGNGLTAFGTKRFDRANGQRVHVHSLSGMLHTNFQIPSLGYEDFFKATRRLTKDQRELKKAVQRCVFNVLMNNRDDHAKNLSFMLDAERNWKLAPPFDLTYCPGYKLEHFMDVAGEGRAPTRAHIVAAAKAAGLAPKDTEAVIDDILEKASAVEFKKLAKALPIKPKTLTLVGKAIETNRKLLMA